MENLEVTPPCSIFIDSAGVVEKCYSPKKIPGGIFTHEGSSLIMFTPDAQAIRLGVTKLNNGVRIPKVNEAMLLCAVTDERQEVIFVAESGMAKRTRLDDYRLGFKTIFPAVHLKPGDKLKSVFLAKEENDIMILTKEGRAFRGSMKNLPRTERDSKMRPILRLTMRGDDLAAAFALDNNKKYIIFFTTKGFVKKMLLSDWDYQFHRTTKEAVRLNTINGILATACAADDGEEIILLGENGLITINADDLPLRTWYHKPQPLINGRVSSVVQVGKL